MNEIVVVGSANYDLCAYSTRFPLPGETLEAVDFKVSINR